MIGGIFTLRGVGGGRGEGGKGGRGSGRGANFLGAQAAFDNAVQNVRWKDLGKDEAYVPVSGKHRL